MKNKRKLAGKILKCSYQKVRIADGAHEDVKKAITRSDIRGLIAVGKISKSRENWQSKARARKIKTQKRKGRQKGKGSRKGAKHSRLTKKEAWAAKVRVQRSFLRELKEKGLISIRNYRILYKKVKGGFFRNKRHIKLYLSDYNLVEKNNQKQVPQ